MSLFKTNISVLKLFTLIFGFMLVSQLQAEQRDVMEEIVVTGSYIKGSPEDAALPVDVITRADLQDVGDPTIVEMVRNLGITSANVGESNQFASIGQGAAGIATVNLRGLGSARTMVLINGRRQVTIPTRGVDISAIPSSAIGRVEVLKDGAAALYGSDAIGGVVNFITRSNFEGLEFHAANQSIEDAGDQDISVIYGLAGNKWHWTVAAEHEHRDELRARDRDWALVPFGQNPQGGWSSIGNPGTFFPSAAPGVLLAGGTPDPNCDSLGGSFQAGFCRFRYTFFDNLIEDTDSYKLFTEYNYDISEDATMHIEALYSNVDVPEWKTSPAYPPQSLLGPDRFIAASHPGLIDMKAQNPGLFTDLFGVPAAFQGATIWGRMVGSAGIRGGGPEEGSREADQYRFSIGLNGIAFDELGYDFAITYSNRERTSATADMYVERMAFAFDGLGGVGCDPATGTPGVGPCEYYNPFSNAIEISSINGKVNPQFNPAVANSDALLDWLTDRLESEERNELLVVDLVFNGETGIDLGGGNVSWALGAQSRRERFQLDLNDVTNLDKNPCPFNDPQSIVLGNVSTLNCGDGATGLFAFLSGTTEVRNKRTIYGLFGELAIPLSDTVDMQAAIRYEDYGGKVGTTIDPKLAVRWQATDWLTVRGSASTTFRGPPQSLLSGRGTALAFVGAALAFKAIDTVGNANLVPEEATTINFGFIVDTGNFLGSIDYWNFDFSDPLQVESFDAILGQYAANGCADGGAGVGSANCIALRAQVFPLGTTAASVQRIERNWINGADIQTSGIDFSASYSFEALAGDASVGFEGTYTFEFDSDALVLDSGIEVAPAQDYVGRLNDINSFTPLPELKGNIFATWKSNRHSVKYVMRYTDEYKDKDASLVGSLTHLATIDDHLTHDIHYNVDVTERFNVSLSVFNLTDEDPPLAALDLNYDPLTHNGFGRMIKLGVTYTAF